MKIEIVGAHDRCAPCRKLKQALINANVEFSFYDMDKDSSERLEELRLALREAGAKVIPALFLDGEYQKVDTAQDLLIEKGIL